MEPRAEEETEKQNEGTINGAVYLSSELNEPPSLQDII